MSSKLKSGDLVKFLTIIIFSIFSISTFAQCPNLVGVYQCEIDNERLTVYQNINENGYQVYEFNGIAKTPNGPEYTREMKIIADNKERTIEIDQGPKSTVVQKTTCKNGKLISVLNAYSKETGKIISKITYSLDRSGQLIEEGNTLIAKYNQDIKSILKCRKK